MPGQKEGQKDGQTLFHRTLPATGGGGEWGPTKYNAIKNYFNN